MQSKQLFENALTLSRAGRALSWIIPATVAIVAIAAGMIFGITTAVHDREASRLPEPDNGVIRVNDDTVVTFREMEIFLAQDRSSVYSAFAGDGTTPGAAFWTTRSKGTTPQQTLLRDASRDAVKQSVLFEFAAKYKLLNNTSFASFEQAWQAENLRRQQALQEGKPIYGPQQYTEANYLVYVTGNLEQALQDKLVSGGVIKVTPGEIRQYYDEHKSTFEPTTGYGPQADAFTTSTQKQIRQILTQNKWDSIVGLQTKQAHVTYLADFYRIARSGCILSGQC